MQKLQSGENSQTWNEWKKKREREGCQDQTMTILLLCTFLFLPKHWRKMCFSKNTVPQTQNKWTAIANDLITCKHYLILLKIMLLWYISNAFCLLIVLFVCLSYFCCFFSDFWFLSDCYEPSDDNNEPTSNVQLSDRDLCQNKRTWHCARLGCHRQRTSFLVKHNTEGKKNISNIAGETPLIDPLDILE